MVARLREQVAAGKGIERRAAQVRAPAAGRAHCGEKEQVKGTEW